MRRGTYKIPGQIILKTASKARIMRKRKLHNPEAEALL